MTSPTPFPEAQVTHRTVQIDGIGVFYREAGPPDAPVVLLPHGYPSSSFQYRNFMPALGDRWRLNASDYPGFGYSETPARRRFDYTFDGYADFLERFVEGMGLTRYAIYLHDYGSQFGLRLAMKFPERVAALILQNGDIYEDQHGPKYGPLKEFWANPSPEGREKLAEAVSEEGFRDEFVGEIPERLVERVSPDLWKLSWSLMKDDTRRENVVNLLADQGSTLDWFPKEQAYLREHRPPTLIVWGPHRVHARRRRPRLSAGPAGCGVAPSRRGSLGARDEPRRDRRPRAGIPRTRTFLRML